MPGLSALGLLAALGSAAVGFVLAEVYRPRAPADRYGEVSLQGSAAWSDAHRWLTLVFLGASIALAAALIWSLRRVPPSAGRAAVLLAASVIAVLAAALTMWTRGMVEWHQLGLWVVTNDIDVSGYWMAAFDDRVRFSLLDGREVARADYGLALAVHLGAPVIGAVALLITTVTSLDPRPAAGEAAGSGGELPGVRDT